MTTREIAIRVRRRNGVVLGTEVHEVPVRGAFR